LFEKGRNKCFPFGGGQGQGKKKEGARVAEKIREKESEVEGEGQGGGLRGGQGCWGSGLVSVGTGSGDVS